MRDRGDYIGTGTLTAAAQLLDERGLHGFTVDEVARRSGVSKATIYKHWTSGFDIAVNAYGDSVTDAVPVADTGDVIHDLTSQIRRLAEFYASPRGRVVAQLLAAGTGQADGSALLRKKFFGKRRGATHALIEQGKARWTGRPRPARTRPPWPYVPDL